MGTSILKSTTSRISSVEKCRRKFIYYFPRVFRDKLYLEWERNYKWTAHLNWQADLNKAAFRKLLDENKHQEIARRAIQIESRTNLLFSFEKMALRDAVKSVAGAQRFATALFDYVYGEETMENKFEEFATALLSLPIRQTKVHSWPVQTIFGFIADPAHHIFLKPRVTQLAAKSYGFNFDYRSTPNWNTYKSLLDFASELKKSLRDFHPKDLIDIQSFIWVLGSDEYPW